MTKGCGFYSPAKVSPLHTPVELEEERTREAPRWCDDWKDLDGDIPDLSDLDDGISDLSDLDSDLPDLSADRLHLDDDLSDLDGSTYNI